MVKTFIKLPVFVLVMVLPLAIIFIPSCRKPVIDKAADQAADPATFSNARLSLATGAAPLRVFTLAGSSFGFANGTLTAAQFRAPGSIAVDAIGNTYIADRDNNMIRKVTPAGVVTTFAGNTTPGFTNGQGAAASFRTPTGVAIDAAGIVYVADSGNNVIRKIVPLANGEGDVTTLAGPANGEAGFTDNAPAAAAQFNGPVSVAVDASGTNVYVTDVLNVRIRKIAAGFVSTLAGNGQTGNNPDSSSIPGHVASFKAPAGIVVNNAGIVYLADKGNNRIRKITPAGVVSPAAGDLNGTAGNTDGSTTVAMFNAPAGIAIDASGTLYIADKDNNRIRTITLTANGAGTVNTLAGTSSGFLDGLPSVAQFKSPTGIAVDAVGNVFVADQGNNRVREIAFGVMVSTLAGNGTAGTATGHGTAAQFYGPTAIALDAFGHAYVANYVRNDIRGITLADTAVWLFVGDGTGTMPEINFPAVFSLPSGVATDPSGNVYVAENHNNRIRKVTPSRLVWNYAGYAYGFTDGPASSANFFAPFHIAFDASGNLYVADSYNNRIRKITPPANGPSIVSTLAGNGSIGFSNGPGSTARFNNPTGIAVDAAGNVYVADKANHVIRKITVSADGTTVVSTLAGNGTAGFKDGPGSTAMFNAPWGVAADASGNVYVADTYNNRIRKISPEGFVSTFAGDGTGAFRDGFGTMAQFYWPAGIAIDASGALYVADYLNHRIRKIQ
jgi:sugar lactone lactonase YvrE